MPNTDIIVVGGGSAGCVFSHRLAHESKLRITLLEAPSGEAPLPDQQRPSQWLNLLGGEEDWKFQTEANPFLARRSLNWPRGRGLGGSGRINSMIWFPPTHQDFKNLADATGSTVDEVRNSFSQVQRLVAPEEPKWISDASQNFIRAAKRFGGGKAYQRVNRIGKRWHPAAFVDHDNIQVVRAIVDRIVFDDDRPSAVITTKGERIQSERGIILCAGAIGTPTILMRSGIGPADVLSQFGIDTVQDVPAVGENLQDHLVMPVIFSVDECSRFVETPSRDDVSTWESTGGGPVASNIAESGGLFDEDNLQIHVTPTHYLKFPQPNAPAAMTIGVNVTQPISRGRLRIQSRDPASPPKIDPGYFLDKSDLAATICGVELAREIANTEPLNGFVAKELTPGSKRQDDEQIAKSIARFAQTLYHPTGTANGVDIGGIVIADASAIPQITVGNPNAAVMTLAYHLAGQLLD